MTGQDQGRSALRSSSALLTSVALMMAGTGLSGTLLAIRGTQGGFRAVEVGALASGYYLGFLVGSPFALRAIRKVGHIRVFAALAALASAAVLLPVIGSHPIAWTLERALHGASVAGMFVVAESWLNGSASLEGRGGLLSAYMIVTNGSIALGQVIVGVQPDGVAPFVISSVLVSVAVVPLALSTRLAPVDVSHDPLPLRELVGLAPIAVVAALAAGVLTGAGFGALPVWALERGGSAGDVSALLIALIAGSVVFQAIWGRWSDRTDRRRVVVVVATTAALAASVAAGIDPVDRDPGALAAWLVFGGAALPLYSLGASHAADRVGTDRVVAASSAMVAAYGIGAILGPVGGAALVPLGRTVFPMTLVIVALLVVIAALVDLRREAAVAPELHFESLPAGSGPLAAALSEDVEVEYAAPDEEPMLATPDELAATQTS